jgi:cell division GTPase FtsZ
VSDQPAAGNRNSGSESGPASGDLALALVAVIVQRIVTTLPRRPGGSVDLADLALVLGKAGRAYFGEGEAEGANRAAEAAERALTALSKGHKR